MLKKEENLQQISPENEMKINVLEEGQNFAQKRLKEGNNLDGPALKIFAKTSLDGITPTPAPSINFSTSNKTQQRGSRAGGAFSPLPIETKEFKNEQERDQDE
mmetsp:Transcript_9623/g.8470  ORF Transcript_9623/g.8470 Transcript_9623/m.8470 type:complete len:103 (+) Transcript_9623:899-1207(+)